MMRKIDSFLLMSILFITTQCSNGAGEENYGNIQKIEKGMKQDEVHSIMNNSPIEIKGTYWSDTLFVESYESVFGASDHYKIIYLKKDSTVVDVSIGN